MMQTFLDKTSKGRDEIAQRRHLHSPRLRALLLLVDGRRSREALAGLVTGIDIDAGLRLLLEQGFIHQVSALSTEQEVAEPAGQHSPEDVQSEQDEPLLALHRFYADTIRRILGMRGFFLQRQLDRATSLEDIRALAQPYLEAVRKAAGEEAALGLQARLRVLLEQAEAGALR